MNLPTIGICVHFFSIAGQPQVKALSPQGDPTLWFSTIHTQNPKT
jgi:hypothetical protein